MNFLVVIHIVITVALIVLVLMQDSKGGGALGMGGGSNSILGSTGAQNLYTKLTRWVATIFALTCLGLSWMVTNQNRSVIDSSPIVNTPPATSAPAAPAENKPAETAPAAPQNSTQPATK